MKNIFALCTLLALSGLTLVGCAGSNISNVSTAPPSDDTIVLFDGKDFSKWIGEEGGPVKWKITGGAMEIVPGSGSIITKQNFQDFHLHLEFNLPTPPSHAVGQQRCNSGVYIQQRYEIQILDSFGVQPGPGDCAAVYKTKAPDKNACKKPGQWQSYDIFFRSPRWDGNTKTEDARITVLHNGVLVHNNVTIPNKTGAGQPEGPRPGPIKLQDHGSNVKFRNIWIVPLD